MGAVFTLVFLMIIVGIGAIPILTGIILLAVWGYKRRRNPEEKHKGMKRAGIILIIIGVLILASPVIAVMLYLYKSHLEWLQNEKAEKYSTTYIDTGVEITAKENQIYKGFDFQDKYYVKVSAMEVEYEDEGRGEAVANVADSEMTVFDYDSPSGCDMLCIERDIYCWEEEKEELEEYYRQGEFKYQISFEDPMEKVYQKEVDFENDVFFGLYDVKTDYTEMTDYYEGKLGTEDILGRPRSIYELKQSSVDGEFNRGFEVVIFQDGEVYLRERTPVFYEYDNGEIENLYKVIEPVAKKKLLEYEEILKQMKEK